MLSVPYFQRCEKLLLNSLFVLLLFVCVIVNRGFPGSNNVEVVKYCSCAHTHGY